MDVAGGDTRQALLRHPAEELVTVEQLEAVREPPKVVVLRPPLRQARLDMGTLAPVGMGGDECGAGPGGVAHGSLDALVDVHVLVQADRDRVRRAVRIAVVVGQLEPGKQQEVVERLGTRCLSPAPRGTRRSARA